MGVRFLREKGLKGLWVGGGGELGGGGGGG